MATQPGEQGDREPEQPRNTGDITFDENDDLQRERKVHRILGIVFAAIGIFVSIDIIHLTSQVNNSHTHIENQIKCNNQLIKVLRKRSDARLVVDNTTRGAQDALAALLEDIQEHGGAGIQPDDPHVVRAVKEFNLAADARANPELWDLYPDCSMN